MTRFHSPVRRTRRVVWIAVAAGIVAAAPSVRARLLLNVGQVASLHGDAASAYESVLRALALAPDDAALAWRAGELGLASGRRDASLLARLEELALHAPVSRRRADVLFTMLMDSRPDRAVSLFRAQPYPPLGYPVAARLALLFERSTDAAAEAALMQALQPASNAGGIDYPALLAARSGADGRASGPGLRETLEWRRHTSPALPLLAKSEPIERDRAQRGEVAVGPFTLSLGPDLVTNGGFEARRPGTDDVIAWSRAFWWGWYVVGTDARVSCSGGRAGRVDGLAQPERPAAESPRAGFMSSAFPIAGRGLYLISVCYRTRGAAQGGPSVWVSAEGEALLNDDLHLEASEGQWTRADILVRHRLPSSAIVTPMLRLFGEGTVWFDDFQFREVITGATGLGDGPAVFYRRPSPAGSRYH